MKRIMVFVLIFIALMTTYSFGQEEINILGQAGILIDLDCHEILYEKNAYDRLYPASTTKIMTAILAIEHGDMKDIVLVDDEIISLTEGAHIAMDYDEEMVFEDVLNAMLIASGNDAALALGKHVGGSLENFVQMMNHKAEELGAKNTHFVNPSGLHDEAHYSTAYDLSLISSYAWENEVFRDIVKKASYEIGPTNKKEESRYLYNTNKFLYGNEKMNLDGRILPIEYEGITGGKTGTTSHAKSCLVSFASRAEKNLMAVVLKSSHTGVYADTTKLLNHGFNDFGRSFLGRTAEFVDNIDVENGTLPYVSAILDNDLLYSMRNGDENKVEKVVSIKPDIKAPISKGDILGEVEYFLDGRTIGHLNVISTMDVDPLPPLKFYHILLDKWYLLVFALMIVFRIVFLYNRSRRRKKRYSRNYSQYY